MSSLAPKLATYTDLMGLPTDVRAEVNDDQSIARIAPFDAIELEVGRLFLPRDGDEVVEE